MRAFEVLTKAEYDIRGCAYPRYHLEMALLRWIHLRQLVPIADLIQGLEKGAPPTGRPQPGGLRRRPAAVRAVPRSGQTIGATAAVASCGAGTCSGTAEKACAASAAAAVGRRRNGQGGRGAEETAKAPAAGANRGPHVQPVAPEMLKDAFLAEVRKAKKFFYGTVVAQAQRIDIDGDRVVFTFAPQHRALRVQLDQSARLARRARVAALGPQDDGRLRRRRRTARQGRRRGAARRTREEPPVGAAPAGARRFGRAGDARRVRRRDQGCRGDVGRAFTAEPTRTSNLPNR